MSPLKTLLHVKREDKEKGDITLPNSPFSKLWELKGTLPWEGTGNVEAEKAVSRDTATVDVRRSKSGSLSDSRAKINRRAAEQTAGG